MKLFRRRRKGIDLLKKCYDKKWLKTAPLEQVKEAREAYRLAWNAIQSDDMANHLHHIDKIINRREWKEYGEKHPREARKARLH